MNYFFKNKKSLLFSILFLLSCSHDTKNYSDRKIAAIDNFPIIPRIGFIENQPYLELFKKWNAVAKDANSKINADKIFYGTDAPKYQSIDRLYQEILKRTKKILNNPDIPDPQIVIVKDRSMNAFVMALPYCVDRAVMNENLISSTSKSDIDPAYTRKLKIVSSSNKGSMANLAYNSGSADCVPFTQTETLEFIASISNHSIFYEYNRKTYQCSINKNVSHLSFVCPDLKLGFKIADVQVGRTLPYIFVNAGLFEEMTQFVFFESIMAHELGHYYLGHAYSATTPSAFFYSRTDHDHSFRPRPSTQLSVFGNLMLDFSRIRSGQTLQGYFNHSIAGEHLILSIKNFSDREDGKFYEHITSSNEKLCKQFLDKSLTNKLVSYLYEPVTSTTKKVWANKVFGDLKNCLTTVKITKYSYQSSFFSHLGARIQDYIFQDAPKENYENAWVAFTELEAILSKKINGLFSSQELRELGYYTYEEEADAFALNYLGENKKSMQSLRDSFMSSLETVINFQAYDGSEIQRCYHAANSGWILDNKVYTPLPKDFSNYHHDMCFRLFNFDFMRVRMGHFPPEDSSRKNEFAQQYIEIHQAYKNNYWLKIKSLFNFFQVHGDRLIH